MVNPTKQTLCRRKILFGNTGGWWHLNWRGLAGGNGRSGFGGMVSKTSNVSDRYYEPSSPQQPPLSLAMTQNKRSGMLSQNRFWISGYNSSYYNKYWSKWVQVSTNFSYDILRAASSSKYSHNAVSTLVTQGQLLQVSCGRRWLSHGRSHRPRHHGASAWTTHGTHTIGTLIPI